MRIMLGADTYPPDVNGAARFTERLGRGLVDRGHEVHLVAPSPVGRPYTENRDGVIVHRIRSHRYPMVQNFQICMPWEARPAIAKIVEKVAPDVCHAQAHFICGRYLIVAAHAQNRPLVATNHFMPENLTDHAHIPEIFHPLVSRIAYWDLGRIFRKAGKITAPTPRAVELLNNSSANIPEAEAISCGIDTEKFGSAREKFVPNQIPEILFVGRLDQEKRVNELIEAVGMLPADAQCRVVIVGDGAHREDWKELARHVGASDRIDFRGFISEEELIEAYGHCDIFCIPGIAELQSLVTLEAMCAAKPIVAADAMALPHLCHPERNGYLYQPGDIAELSGHLAKLIRDPELRRRMGAESLEMVQEHAIDATLDRFEAVYQEQIDKKSAS
ncbi:MAG: glycosyltransferase [Propionibacteriaceae bacterium]